MFRKKRKEKKILRKWRQELKSSLDYNTWLSKEERDMQFNLQKNTPPPNV